MVDNEVGAEIGAGGTQFQCIMNYNEVCSFVSNELISALNQL